MIAYGILVGVRLVNPLLTAENQDSRRSCKMQNFANQFFFKIPLNAFFFRTFVIAMFPCRISSTFKVTQSSSKD